MEVYEMISFEDAGNQQTDTIGGNKSVSVTFNSMPATLAEFTALPQAALTTPFDTAAMTAAALFVYANNKDVAVAMLNYLRGPNTMTPRDVSFLADRMSQNKNKGFLGASYFSGASPENNYAPSSPYTVTAGENPYSYTNQGHATLYIKSGGADSPRPVTLRQAKDGKWYLWEYSSLLLDVRAPESTNPWA